MKIETYINQLLLKIACTSWNTLSLKRILIKNIIFNFLFVYKNYFVYNQNYLSFNFKNRSWTLFHSRHNLSSQVQKQKKTNQIIWLLYQIWSRITYLFNIERKNNFIFDCLVYGFSRETVHYCLHKRLEIDSAKKRCGGSFLLQLERRGFLHTMYVNIMIL